MKSEPELEKPGVRIQWDVKIPLKDGVRLSATLYMLEGIETPSPVILTLTPYIGHTYHDWALRFAECGFPFLAVDVRGRGNSEGSFSPFAQEASDGYDVVEWAARQPYCDGQVAMWGGSYMGYAQWATAKAHPPHLVTIVPAASPYVGVDFPFCNNIFYTYLPQWLLLVSGRTARDLIFKNNELFWRDKLRRWLESGAPFKSLDAFLGNASPAFQRWVEHPHQDSYWDLYNPTDAQYGNLSMPILTITGIYDSDQAGALTHYRQHLEHSMAEARSNQYLVIGPWDHAGTRIPQAEFCGIKTGPASLVDIGKLCLDWYQWTLGGGPKPSLLRKNVVYYLLGKEEWRYADALEDICAEHLPLYLDSQGTASQVFASGTLGPIPGTGTEDSYVYDPRDTAFAAVEAAGVGPFALRPTFPVDNLRDQTLVFGRDCKQLIYHSFPFERDTEIGGFVRLEVWMAIDCPDTDFRATVYEIGVDGSSVLLTTDCMRARYRESLRSERLIGTESPLRYYFERFTFVSRLISKGNRLRLVIGPINSIYFEKNYNSGGVVAEESMKDAREVTVKLFHDYLHPSALYLPLANC